ncbi:hypothetical protein SISNIDRAFT_504140 [Sistotremastrum niveocremeum HHB9708]|uniref:DUF6535 domain-containing protein n=1 Tax=Sistotremastrum niveocremeum HHB9708 TaxID=1314777 RepID=A0A164M6Z9_9AGAM|nr:hypothetical protein SISNIDRAFT_504140 [Sistotremastrum niveocremeum HHB9708]
MKTGNCFTSDSEGVMIGFGYDSKVIAASPGLFYTGRGFVHGMRPDDAEDNCVPRPATQISDEGAGRMITERMIQRWLEVGMVLIKVWWSEATLAARKWAVQRILDDNLKILLSGLTARPERAVLRPENVGGFAYAVGEVLLANMKFLEKGKEEQDAPASGWRSASSENCRSQVSLLDIQIRSLEELVKRQSIHLWTLLIPENTKKERGNIIRVSGAVSGTRFELQRNQILPQRNLLKNSDSTRWTLVQNSILHEIELFQYSRDLLHIRAPFTRRLWQQDEESDAIGQEESATMVALPRNPEPPDPNIAPLILSDMNSTPPESIWPTSPPDPFDTPLFNRLISLIEKQTATLEEQRAVMEEQRDVMKDMRLALDACRITEPVNTTLTAGPKELSQATRATNLDDIVSRASSPDSQPPASILPTSIMMNTAPISTSDPDDPDDSRVGYSAAQHSNEPADVEGAADVHPIRDAERKVETAAPKSSRGHIHDAIMMLNETMKRVNDTLLDHGSKLNVLIRDALKDDQPYDLKPMEDESTCTALYEIAMARTKEQVDEWIKRMDVSLVFVCDVGIKKKRRLTIPSYQIALFSAVLTAFLIPAIQNLFPSSTSSTSDSPPQLPDISLQNVCILNYLALTLAVRVVIVDVQQILDAVLCVLGRQWMSHLTTRPEGSTYRERLLRHVERERVAKRWLQYLVEGLHIILLGSIGLFMTGLLYQFRNIAGSFDEDAPSLLITWKVGLSFSSVILAVVAAATIHALLYEVSPFGGPFGKLLLKVIKTLSRFFELLADLLFEDLSRWLKARISWIPWDSMINVLVLVSMVPLLLSKVLIEVWRVEFNIKDNEKLVVAFMDLIAEASDPKLLERAVGSFSYVQWFEDEEGTADQLEKTENRLLATDTSVRVRETLKARAHDFIPYGTKNWMKVGPGLTKELVQSFPAFQSYPERFTKKFLDTSFREDNADLRAPADIDVDTVPISDSHSAIPMLPLTHPPPVIASSDRESEPPLAPDSWVVFDQLSTLENAHQED